MTRDNQSRNIDEEFKCPSSRLNTYGMRIEETMLSSSLDQQKVFKRSISKSEVGSSLNKNKARKTLRSLRDYRRNTNNYSSNYLFSTPNKDKKLRRGFKVDLNKSLNITADTTMSMNGMGVYMNVIRESQDLTLKKEKLALQKSRILGMSFENFGTKDMAQINNFIR